MMGRQDRARDDERRGDITLKDLARQLDTQHRELRHDLEHNQRDLHRDLKTITEILSTIATLLTKGPKVGFTFSVGSDYELKKEVRMPLELELHQGTGKDVTAVPKYNDRPVSLDGPAVWSVLSGEMTLGATLQDGVPLPADGLKAALHFSGPNLGDTLFQIRGDARVGPDVVEIIDTVLVHGIADEANTFSLVATDEYTIPTP